ncbi:MAG: pyridoxal-phosphate dependent enzyme [Desulfurococcales archaeon]|nr:pyridoxal-phosphate dependent enzyme [Desulfurococcales archaeon]
MHLVCPGGDEPVNGLICSDEASIAIPKDYSFIEDIMKRISMSEGLTPIFNSIEYAGLYFKDETRNPTGSFRDRSALPSISFLAYSHVDSIIVSGDGNTCASYAAYATRAGISCTSVLPEDSDVVKVEQVRVYGCKALLKGTTMDETHTIAEKIGSKQGVKHIRVDSEPYALLGLVGLGLEIYDHIKEYSFDAIVVPVGSGATLASIYTAFNREGVRNVRIIGVQAGEGSYASLFSGDKPTESDVHYSIRYMRPPLLKASYKATLATKGWGTYVPLPQVYEESIRLSGREGIFAEPAAVAGYIVGRKLVRERKWKVLVLITSTGLKTVSPRTRSLMGETKIGILQILKKHKRLHGYMIWKLLGSRRVSPQAVYSSLKWLEEKGLVSSLVVGRRRFYQITAEGEKALVILGHV